MPIGMGRPLLRENSFTTQTISMKTFKSSIFGMSGMLALVLTTGLVGCDKEEDDVVLASKTYAIQVKDQLGISGTVKFIETSSTVTTIEITLEGADANDHPANIRQNSIVAGGDVALTLSPVVNGFSSTTVTALNNGTAINYSQLMVYDGYVNIYQSSGNLTTIIGNTDIGGNELTTTSVTYQLAQEGSTGVSGTALFQKRQSGKSLVTVSLNGTIEGGLHPVAIHIGSVTSVGGGPVVKLLSPVNGATGKSYSNLSFLTDGTSISYDQMLLYNGYLAIHESESLMENVLCQGNIGTH
jgi:hypothetical protein